MAQLGAPIAAFWSASLIAPIVEELAKGVALFALYLLFRQEFDGPLDGIIYGALIGLGFGMTENLFYFFGSYGQGGWAQWLLTVAVRAGVFGLIHAFYTSLVGAGIGYMRLSTQRARPLLSIAGLLAAMFFHGFHNLALSLPNSDLLSSLMLAVVGDWSGIFLMFVIVTLAWRQERTWVRVELQEEVALGIITPSQYAAITRYPPRLSAVLGHREVSADARTWRQLVDAATELAIKKHQASLDTSHADRPNWIKTHAVINQLRANIANLNANETDLPQMCRACHHPLRPETSYCTQCGTPLDKALRHG